MNIDIFAVYASQNLVTGVASAAALLGPGSVVRLWNNSTFNVFVRIGAPGVTATDLVDVGIPPNGVEMFRIAPMMVNAAIQPNTSGLWYIAAISPGGAGNLNVQTGEGI